MGYSPWGRKESDMTEWLHLLLLLLYTQNNTKFLDLRYLVSLTNRNLLFPPTLCCKTPIYSSSSIHLLMAVSQSYLKSCLPGCSLILPQIKLNFQVVQTFKIFHYSGWCPPNWAAGSWLPLPSTSFISRFILFLPRQSQSWSLQDKTLVMSGDISCAYRIMLCDLLTSAGTTSEKILTEGTDSLKQQ